MSTAVSGAPLRQRLTWAALGAVTVLMVLLFGAVVHYLSTWKVFFHEVATECSDDGRVCIEWNRQNLVPAIGAGDQFWVSVDMHDICGSWYEVPFALDEESFEPIFTKDYVEVAGPDGEVVRYPAYPC